MSEKARELSPEEKLRAVKEYLSGKGSTCSIVDKYGVTDTSIRRWVDRYICIRCEKSVIFFNQLLTCLSLSGTILINDKICKKRIKWEKKVRNWEK